MTVRPHQRIRQGNDAVALWIIVELHNFRQIFQIDLVHDAGGGRHNFKVFEGFLPPVQKLVALAIAHEFHLGVARDRIGTAEDIHLHRMVNDQVDRRLGVDLLWIAAHARHRAAQRRQINQRGHTGEVLQDHARRTEWDLHCAVISRIPVRQILHGFRLKMSPVLISQGVLQQHFDAEWQPVDIADAVLC